jgi:hypothetical protein
MSPGFETYATGWYSLVMVARDAVATAAAGRFSAGRGRSAV